MIKRIKRLIDRIRTKKIEINTRYVMRDGWKVQQYGGFVYLEQEDLETERLDAIKAVLIGEAQKVAAKIVKENIELILKTPYCRAFADPVERAEWDWCAGTYGWKMSFIVRDEGAKLENCKGAKDEN